MVTCSQRLRLENRATRGSADAERGIRRPTTNRYLQIQRDGALRSVGGHKQLLTDKEACGGLSSDPRAHGETGVGNLGRHLCSIVGPLPVTLALPPGDGAVGQRHAAYSAATGTSSSGRTAKNTLRSAPPRHPECAMAVWAPKRPSGLMSSIGVPPGPPWCIRSSLGLPPTLGPCPRCAASWSGPPDACRPQNLRSGLLDRPRRSGVPSDPLPLPG